MKDISFENRVVIITGGGGAIGRAFAVEIARRGGSVVVNDLGGEVSGGGGSTGYADAVVDEIRAAGGTAVASYEDVSTLAGSRRIAETALDTFGRVDVLMNNAGNMRCGSFEALDEGDLHAVLQVHLVGSFNLSQAVWTHMRAQGYGRIVFTSSGAGVLGHPTFAAYGAAKAGMMGLMNTLALEGGDHGILCNALLPNAASRMTRAVGSLRRGEAPPPPGPHMAVIAPTMQAEFMMGIGVYLASEACTTTRELYSSLGGRIARAFVGMTEGWYGSTERGASPDDIAAHINEIRDTTGFHIPEGLGDEYSIVGRTLLKG